MSLQYFSGYWGSTAIQTQDGGYALGGSYLYNLYAVKLDANGKLQWKKSVDNGSSSAGYSIAQSLDGGYGVVGTTDPTGGGIDYGYLVKFDPNGSIAWTRYITGIRNWLFSVKGTSDGGFVTVGRAFNYIIPAKAYAYVAKFDVNGGLQWAKGYTNPWGDGEGTDIIQTSDGGYAVVGDATYYPSGADDIYLVKLDSTGTQQWSRSIGGTWIDDGYSIIQTNDGGYAIAGYSEQVAVTNPDGYLVKLDSTGALQWSVTIGTPDIEYAYSVTQAKDSGYAVVGYSTVVGVGPFQGFIVKLDQTGAFQWSKKISPSGDDVPYSIMRTFDNGYVIGGNESGNNNHNVFKLDSAGTGCCTSPMALQVNPAVTTSKVIISTDTSVGVTGSTGVIDTGGIIVYVCSAGCAKPIANAGQDITICMGDSANINANWAGNYSWVPSGGLNNTSIQNPTAFPTVTSTYSLIVANTCSSDTDAVTVFVVPPEFASISGNSISCSADNVTLSASGGTSYLWSTGETTSSVIVNPSSSATYSVSVFNSGCIDDTSIAITVLPNPTATTSGNITIYQGQTIMLTASGGTTYLWNNGETTTAITVAPMATIIYCVTVVDTNNCKDTACVMVDVKSPCDTAGTFYFPNAFSPNDDGENDFLKVYYRNMDCIESLQLIIYDRWGEKVFETADKNFQWDGNYQNKTLITQVLAFHLSVKFTDGNAINRKGNISLVK